MEEFAQTIYAVAKNAYIDLQFDPDLVKSYRLIGFENKLNALSDTSNIIQGGEIGSGHTLMALIEIEPARAGTDSIIEAASFAKVALHFELPADTVSHVEEYKVPNHFLRFEELPKPYRFATTVALFGSLLKKSRFTEKISWDDLLKMSEASFDRNDISQQEYLTMLEQAKKIYHRNRKSRK
jgi:Ca-activated chloride channel homolog